LQAYLVERYCITVPLVLMILMTFGGRRTTKFVDKMWIDELNK